MGQGFQLAFYNNTSRNLSIGLEAVSNMGQWNQSIGFPLNPAQSSSLYYFETNSSAGTATFTVRSADSGGWTTTITIQLEANGLNTLRPGTPWVMDVQAQQISSGAPGGFIFPVLTLNVYEQWTLGMINLVETLSAKSNTIKRTPS